MTETNFGLHEIREEVPVEMELKGVRIQLSFAESETPGIRDRMIEILSDAYEKRRLGEKSGEELREIQVKI